MSEEVANATEVEGSSFGDALKSRQPKAESAPVATEAAVETPKEPVPAEAPKVEPAAAPAEPAVVAAPQASQTPPGLGFVPIAVVQAERAKRQELERAFEEFKQQGSYTPADSAPPAQPDLAAMEQRMRQDLSEQYARKQYPDYDEKLNAFASEIWDVQTGTLKNEALWNSIQSSPLPAEAAYKAGIQILEAKKLGGWDVISDPVKYRQALENSIKADLEKKIRAEVEAEIASKALSKSKTITDISSARSSSGSTEAGFQPTSMGEMLASIKNRKR